MSEETQTVPNKETPALAEAPQKPKAVLLSRHHDISAFCSTDQTRYVIGGAHYDPKRGILEATDGRQLIRVPVEESEEYPSVATELEHSPVECIIPTSVLKRGLANIPKKSRLPILEHAKLDANGKVTLTTFDLDNEQSVTSKPIDGNYPDTEQVIWKEEPKFSISLCPEYLEKIAHYASKHHAEKANSIKLSFQDELSPMKWTIQLDNGKEVMGLLMPIRMS